MAVTPDSLPVLIGDSLPFDYPPGPYIQRIQDNVTLRLYLDEFGRPVPDSVSYTHLGGARDVAGGGGGGAARGRCPGHGA